jgi:hypothetical protein
MASKKNTKPRTFSYLENWSDGTERVVIRRAGKFVDNVSLTALRKSPKVATR